MSAGTTKALSVLLESSSRSVDTYKQEDTDRQTERQIYKLKNKSIDRQRRLINRKQHRQATMVTDPQAKRQTILPAGLQTFKRTMRQPSRQTIRQLIITQKCAVMVHTECGIKKTPQLKHYLYSSNHLVDLWIYTNRKTQTGKQRDRYTS